MNTSSFNNYSLLYTTAVVFENYTYINNTTRKKTFASSTLFAIASLLLFYNIIIEL